MPASNELRHYGVPGMKWGKRNAAARLQKRITKGEEQLFKLEPGGNANRAVGKLVVGNVLGAALSANGLRKVPSISRNPAVIRGATIAIVASQTAAALNGVSTIRNIRAYEKSREGK